MPVIKWVIECEDVFFVSFLHACNYSEEICILRSHSVAALVTSTLPSVSIVIVLYSLNH